MKALSLTQPWATLVAIGAKKIETRSWYAKYRGPVAIHASKGFPAWARDLCAGPPFSSALQAEGLTVLDLPTGAVLAVVDLWRVLKVDYNVTALLPPPEPEQSFGDYTPLRFAWYLRNIRRLDDPVPVKGALGLWEWKDGKEQPNLWTS